MHNAGCCSSLCVTGEKEQTEITVITTPYLKKQQQQAISQIQL